MDPKERMKSSHCTLVGSPILLVGVARRSYDLNIWSIIFKSASRSWLFTDLERKRKKMISENLIVDQCNAVDPKQAPKNELRFKNTSLLKGSVLWKSLMHFLLISQRKNVFNGGQSGQLIKWDKKTFNYEQVWNSNIWSLWSMLFENKYISTSWIGALHTNTFTAVCERV